MMNLLLPFHYFIWIPSVLAIIMVSRVHPFPYSETKSWMHNSAHYGLLQQQNQQLSSHKVSRSSFGGECPDCLSQEEASLSLLLPTNKNKDEQDDIHSEQQQQQKLLPQKEMETIMLVLPQAKASTWSSSKGEGEPTRESSLAQNSSNNGSANTTNSYYKTSRRKIQTKVVDQMHSRASNVGSVSLVRGSDDGEGDLSKKIILRRKIRDVTRAKPCLAEREQKLQKPQSQHSTEYIPNCRRNGSYKSLQCSPLTKSCWCVTRNGSPIQGTSFLSSPDSGSTVPRSKNCAKYNRGANAKSTTRRSSHFRKNRKCTGGNNHSCVAHDVLVDDDEDSSDSEDPVDDESDDVENSDLSCNHADWSRFNVALLKTFRSEYNRYHRSGTSINSEAESPSDTTVLAWKFDHVDRNKDMVLQRNETNTLKNLVKQLIQPRSCAKNFIASCSNGDHQITKVEWLDCLRIPSDVNLPFDMFNSLVDSSTTRGMHPSMLLKPVSSSSASGSGSGSMELTPPLLSSSILGETTEQSNCLTDKQSALVSQKQGESIIIPECTANGNYKKVQCAQGKAYCWCVEEESGIQIPNTVVVNSTPDCNNGYSKPMKGCSVAKKHKFLMDLFSTLKSRMLEATRDGSRSRKRGDLSRNMSPEEQASRWYFTELDVNSNGVLDRKEWKTFRNETSMDKRLKKCGKKLPRHCDVNQDKKITMAEWLDCLGVKFLGRIPAHSSTKRPVNRSNVPRPGKNPFTNILKHRR